jgi:hypothetical protein
LLARLRVYVIKNLPTARDGFDWKGDDSGSYCPSWLDNFMMLSSTG